MAKIIKQTADQLVLRQSGLPWGRLLKQVCVTGIGTAILLATGPARVDCQRIEPTQASCQFSQPGWLGLGWWRTQSIRNLQAVELETSIDDGVFYQILLQTSDGVIPLRSYKTSGLDNTVETVQRLRTFLKDPNARQVSVAQVDWTQWFALFPGLAFFLSGLQSLYTILFSIRAKTHESYRLDQGQNRLTHDYGGLLRRKQVHYSFFDIRHLVVDLDRTAKTWLFLQMQSGDVFCLEGKLSFTQRTPPRGVEWQQVEPIADALSHHLHRPYQLALGFNQNWVQQQIAQNKPGKFLLRYLGLNLPPTRIWTFDRSADKVICQEGDRVKTYPLGAVSKVEATQMGEVLEKEDSDRDPFYEVNYQISLEMASGDKLIPQLFTSHEYPNSWKPGRTKKPQAQLQAEAVAKHLQDYLNLN